MSTAIHDCLHARAEVGAMDDSNDPDPEVLERTRGPRRYSAKYKAWILDEYERLDKAAKGALNRPGSSGDSLGWFLMPRWAETGDGSSRLRVRLG